MGSLPPEYLLLLFGLAGNIAGGLLSWALISALNF
jgi:hypothetical protein